MNPMPDMKKNVITVLTALAAGWLPGPAVQAQTMTESFDTTPFPPAGWSVTGAPNSRWIRVTNGVNPPAAPHSGPAMARFTVNNQLGAQEVLTTPVIDLSGASGSTPTFGLWMYREGSSTAGDSLSILVNTINSVTGATYLGGIARSRYFVLPNNEPVDGWYQYFFSIPPSFNTDTNYILLRGTCRGGGNIYIDDVQWEEYPFPCAGTPTAGGVVATDSVICDNPGSTTLTLSSGVQGGGITYQWQSGPSATGPWTDFGANASTVSSGPLTADTWFRCYLECANGGVADTSTVLEVLVNPNPAPVVTTNPGPSMTFCNGSAPVVVVASGASFYTWTPNISISANGDTALVGPASNVTYTVVGTDTFGCSAQATLQVQVANTPNVNAIANQDTVCSGDPVNLSATGGGPGFGLQWFWLPDSLTGNMHTVFPTMTTMYIVSGTSNFSGCTGYDSVLVVVNPTPAAGFSYTPNGLMITFTDTSSGGTAWYWDFGDGTTDTLQNPVHLFPGNGSYTVSLTVTDGDCSDTFTQTIVVAGIASVWNGAPVTAWPNPVSDVLTVSFRHDGKQCRLRVYDSRGRIVAARTVSGIPGVVRECIGVQALAPGAYFIHLAGLSGSVVIPFVRE